MPVRPFRLLRISAFLFALAFAPCLFAAPSTYTGSAPVNSQSDDERAAALKTALANVVIEQTGDAGILARADVAGAVAKADRYVLQYSYRENAGGSAPLTLVAQFDADAVDAMRTRLGLLEGAQAAAQDTTSEATVRIRGLRDADDWLRVAGYLAHNNFVRSNRPVAAHGDTVLVRLTLVGDLAHFLDAVTAERTLAIDGAAGAVDGAEATLVLAP